MRFLILSIFLLAVQVLAYVSTSPRGRTLTHASTLLHGRTERTCDTPPPSVEMLRAHRKMRLQPRDAPQNSIQVAAYFHVVRSPETEKWVTPDMISNQIRVLSQAYAPLGISFRVVKTDYTTNRDWAQGNNVLARMKSLRKGNYRDLNLYFLTDWGILGSCPFPTSTNKYSDVFFQDGCSINAATLPGGWAGSQFDRGMTTVHEVGHWFGLFHTFQPSGPGIDWNGPGVCTGTGDYIRDTPFQKDPTDGCPKSKNSCPDQPGDDDIHNYMDYSNDGCYTHFTPYQRRRMFDLWSQFRAGR